MGRAARLVRSPLAWILLVVLAVRAVGLGWGLPASDGWDNDGVAPRDFLPGLAATFAPGSFYTYPPVHLALLAIVTLPVTLLGLARAPSLALADVVAKLLEVPYMTAYSVLARLVSLAMSLGIVVAMARLAEEVRAAELGVAPVRPGLRAHFDDPRVTRAGVCVAVVIGLNGALTYYGKTSNLDVPYLFWASWAILGLARSIARREPGRLRSAFVLAALAIGTKDQAYALFLVSVPALLALAAWRDRSIAVRPLLVAAATALVVLLAVDGALVNPTGFRARLAFLGGSASQDFVAYTADWPGRVSVLTDAARRFRVQYPLLMVAPIALGLVVSLRRRTPTALFPLLVGISFTLAFNMTARRTDARFLLPQALALGFYGGLGIERFAFASTSLLRIGGRLLSGAALAASLFGCIAVDVNLLRDPRYEAEAWLRAHVAPGEIIETYGHNVYLPRMPAQARVMRVGPEPIAGRNPMPGIEEVQAPYELAEQRGATWIVLPEAWVWRFVRGPAPSPGQMIQPTVERTITDEPAARYFDALIWNRTAFPYAYGVDYDASVFPRMDIHGASGRTIWIYRRR